MLKVNGKSASTKTPGMAITYRAEPGNHFGTCPASCGLIEPGKQGAIEIDQDYLELLAKAVPARGKSYTYSHFHWSRLPTDTPTVINYSADTMDQAAEAFEARVPTAVVLPAAKIIPKVQRIEGIQVVTCPHEWNKRATCANCNMCKMPRRDFIVGFHAHGSRKKKASDPNQKGGCYADAGFHSRLAWMQTAAAKGNVIQDDDITKWARSLPRGTHIRHHVAGDIGKFK